jgi:hypothetical protein
MVRRGSGRACDTESAHVLFISAVRDVPHLLLQVHRDAVASYLCRRRVVDVVGGRD